MVYKIFDKKSSGSGMFLNLLPNQIINLQMNFINELLDVTFDSYAEYNEDSKEKGTKCKFGYHVKNITVQKRFW